MANTHHAVSPQRKFKSESDVIDLFGPFEDPNPSTRIIRVPRLGYSSALAHPPPQLYTLPHQPGPDYQDPAMFSNNFAAMGSGPYGLGRVDGLHREQGDETVLYAPPPFPYPAVTLSMPMNDKPYTANAMTTMSPLQTTLYDPAHPTYDGEPQSGSSSCSPYILESTSPTNEPRKRTSVDAGGEPESETSTTKKSFTARRRKSSPSTDSLSARDRYLEKNRRAATKCRSKQKQQQENLVESAREVEKKNKILKAEVQLLKEDMRGLMHVIGEHNNCTDDRLRMYVQREADRLAAGEPRSPDNGRSLVRNSVSSRGGSTSRYSE